MTLQIKAAIVAAVLAALLGLYLLGHHQGVKYQAAQDAASIATLTANVNTLSVTLGEVNKAAQDAQDAAKAKEQEAAKAVADATAQKKASSDAEKSYLNKLAEAEKTSDVLKAHLPPSVLGY